jgi:hypothetical protein
MRISLRYSTVDEYLTALKESQPDALYSVFKGDFFPYLEVVDCLPDGKMCTKG